MSDREISPYERIAQLNRDIKVLKYVFEGALQMLSENKIKYNAKLIREAAQRAVAENKEEES